MSSREIISSRLSMWRSRGPLGLLAIGLGMAAMAAFVPSVANARANNTPSIPDGVTAELSWPIVTVAWNESSGSADRPVDGYNIYVNGEYKDTEKGGLFHQYNVEGLSGTVAFQVTSFDDGDPQGFSPMSEVATVDIGDRPAETAQQPGTPIVVLDPPAEERDTPVVVLDPPADEKDSTVVILDPPADERDSTAVDLDPPAEETDTPVVMLDPPADEVDSTVAILDPPAVDLDSAEILSNNAPPPPTSSSGGNAFFSVDFQNSPIGTYSESQVYADWGDVQYAVPKDKVVVTEEGSNRFIRVKYPKGAVGHANGGAIWAMNLGSNSGDEMYSSYRLRFNNNFDPVLGGKLPGLSGGDSNSGGAKPDGTDGWSARLIFRPGNQAVQYLYHPDQPTKWGEDLKWGTTYPQNEWFTVETRIKMNTPGQRNGVIQTWLNGKLALDRSDIRYRDNSSFGIDKFLFSTFFGGSGPEWGPSKDEYVDFDDFKFSRSPITH